MGIVLIQGAESLLADRAISQVIATKTGAQTSIFSADELEVGFITDSLAPSLFADARVVVIKDLQDLQGSNVKLTYKERFKTFPWLGDTKYYITKVEKTE